MQKMIRIGTSGWCYSQWRHSIYRGIRQSGWLGYYATHFDTVELNNSFYRLPTEICLKRWRDAVPPSFCFSVKAWRGITHFAKLRDCEGKLMHNLSLLRLLEDRLGPVLFQLPPSLKRDDALLADFLALLPPDIKAIFEFRNKSWDHEDVYRILADANVTLCHPHMKKWTSARILTNQRLYIRMHGPDGWFRGSYSDDFLNDLAEFIAAANASEVYVYFNNTYHDDDALKNAQALRALLGVRLPARLHAADLALP